MLITSFQIKVATGKIINIEKRKKVVPYQVIFFNYDVKRKTFKLNTRYCKNKIV